MKTEASTAPSTKKTDPLPKLFYQANSGDFWLEKKPGDFLKVKDGHVRLHFQASGFYWKEEDKSTGLTAGERLIVQTQLRRAVDYAGPLAGWPTGLHNTADGKRVLVTSAAQYDFGKPKDKAFPFVSRFVGLMLGKEQAQRFWLWLKFAREALQARSFRPGQCLIIAGPPGSGKSFLQVIITEMLGGRVACPYRYMMGLSPFNEDLAQAEHLSIEDKAASTRMEVRREFGTRIKEFTVNERFSVHGKQKTAFDISTFRRVTISVNDEPENLMIVPPLDKSLLDKFSLLRCEDAAEHLHEDRARNLKALRCERAAVAAWLERLECPPALRDHRMGVKSYHDAELLAHLTRIEDHFRLLDIIDEVIFKTDVEPWTGTSNALHAQLKMSDQGWQIDKLCYFPGSCGTFLGRLKSKVPERIQSRVVDGTTHWTIIAPPRPTKDA